MKSKKSLRSIEEIAQHIYRCGGGLAKNENVEAVLSELNERVGGYWGAGISSDKMTWIEQIL